MTSAVNPIGQALPCEHGLLVGLDNPQDPRECQECDWCTRCEAVRRYVLVDGPDDSACSTCGRKWGYQ